MSLHPHVTNWKKCWEKAVIQIFNTQIKPGYTQELLDRIVGPDTIEALDTIKELADAIGEDAHFIDTMNTAIQGLETNKQDKLVSGVNIKTINENSILDEGNLNLVQFDPQTLTDPQKQQARENIDAVSDTALDNKEDNTDIVVESTAISTLTAEVGKYYRFDVPVDTLAITLPTMTDTTTVKTIVFYLTAGTTPAVTFSSTHPVYYSDGFEIAADSTYEVNALWNGAAWIVAAVNIVISNV